MTDTIRITDPATHFTIVSNDVLRAGHITRDARLTYALLLSYAWTDHSCFPSIKRLAQDLDAKPRSITRWLAELELAGWISRHRRHRENLTTLYVLHGPNHQTPEAGGHQTPEADGHRPPQADRRILTTEEDSVLKKTHKTNGTSVPSDLSERTGPDEPTQVLETLGATTDRLSLQLVAKTINDHPETDAIDVAIEYARYRQRAKGSRPIDQDPIKGWVNAMRSAARKGLYQRTTTPDYEPAAPTPTGIPAFDELLQQLHHDVLPGNFDTWFRPLRPARCSAGTLVIEAPTQQHRDWIEQRFAERIADALARTNHPDISITYTAAQEAPT